jgi:hypothetical protein
MKTNMIVFLSLSWVYLPNQPPTHPPNQPTTNQPLYPTEHSPEDGNDCSASQNIFHSIWNLKIHYHYYLPFRFKS